MAVAIRLQRIGRPKQAYYRVVAVDSRRPAQGKPIEILGSYNPRTVKEKEKIAVKAERYQYWLGVGAKPSSTVASLLKASVSKTADQEKSKVKAKARKKSEAKAKGSDAAAAAPAAAPEA